MAGMADHKNARVRALVEAFESGMTVAEAALRVGVGERTVYRWMANDPQFADAVNEARDEADDRVEAVTLGNCLDPDPAHNGLRMFWLKNRRREVYGEKPVAAPVGNEPEDYEVKVGGPQDPGDGDGPAEDVPGE